MSEPRRGLWIFCGDLGDEVDEALQGSKGNISVHVDSSSAAGIHCCMALLSRSRESVDYLAVARKGRGSGGLEKRVVIGPAIALHPPASIESISGELHSRLRRYAAPPEGRATSIPPATMQALLGVLSRSGCIAPGSIGALQEIVEKNILQAAQRLSEISSFERDAVAVALEVYGGSRARREYLDDLDIDDDAPFIRSLSRAGVNILEDRMVEHDVSSFPGARVVKRYRIGAVRFHTETGALTIVNVNRSPVERTLSVDLVYYHHRFHSFTLVQYKRMSGRPVPVYRPRSDSSYGREIARMRDFRDGGSAQPAADVHSYRLHSGEFYFKLCSPEQSGGWGRMLSGMYIPLDLWELFSQDRAGSRSKRRPGDRLSQFI